MGFFPKGGDQLCVLQQQVVGLRDHLSQAQQGLATEQQLDQVVLGGPRMPMNPFQSR
jgi:hypothetical protein